VLTACDQCRVGGLAAMAGDAFHVEDGQRHTDMIVRNRKRNLRATANRLLRFSPKGVGLCGTTAAPSTNASAIPVARRSWNLLKRALRRDLHRIVWLENQR
jgi:hypothetical protein